MDIDMNLDIDPKLSSRLRTFPPLTLWSLSLIWSLVWHFMAFGQNLPSSIPIEKFFAEIAPVIHQGILKKDTLHPIFHGNIDWHSSVHGHFALLRLARLYHFPHGRKIAERFDPEKLQRERDFLQAHPEFEMPYGRAWFLALAIEYEKWSRDQDDEENEDEDNWEGYGLRLRPMADDVADSILQRYRQLKPDPARNEYQNDSWAIYQLYEYFRWTRNEAKLHEVITLIKDNFLASGPFSTVNFSLDLQRGFFFSSYGHWAYLLAKTQSHQDLVSFLKRHPIDENYLQPVILPLSDHHLGMNWSRAWSLKALARRFPEWLQVADAYQKHVYQGLLQYQKYGGNYWSYDHWVPQFAVYALTD